jgi:tRNA A-37 threonylcarbamoyl transferase component Bud32
MPAAVKIYTLKETALSRFVHEVTAYLGIVPVLAVGRLPHNDRPVIALAEGQPVQEPLPSDLFAQAEEALKELHKAGWCHGDIRARNMLCYNQHVVFCDLETCSPATEEGVKQDWHDLQSMLHEATLDQET